MFTVIIYGIACLSQTAFSGHDELNAAAIPINISFGAVKHAFGAFGSGAL
jgi:hypothetical protein